MSTNRIQSFVARLYQSRKLKLTQPEGYFDVHGAWYPYAHEKAGDRMENVKKPTHESRYTYRIHCRSKAHCRLLISRALAGHKVPADVLEVLGMKGNPTSDEIKSIPDPSPFDTIPGVTKGNMNELVKEFIWWMAHRSAAQHNHAGRATDRDEANA